MTPLGSRLDAWMAEAHVSPAEFAGWLGTTSRQLAGLFDGSEVLTLDLASQLEAATGIRADELLRLAAAGRGTAAAG